MAPDLGPLLDETEPQGLGAMFSEGARLLRRHLKAFITLGIGLSALELVLREAGTVFMHRMREAMGIESFWNVEPLEEIGDGTLLYLAASVGLFMASRVVVEVITLLGALATVEAKAGGTLSPAGLLARAGRLLPRVLGAEFLFWGLTALVAFVPPVLLLFGAAVAGSPVLVVVAVVGGGAWTILVFITLMLRWALFVEVIALEDAGAFSSLRRSAELMGPRGIKLFKGPKLALSVLLLLFWTVTSSVQSTFMIPMAILAWMQGIPVEQWPPPLFELPLWGAVPVTLLQALVNALLYPTAGVFLTLFYLDVRVRYDEDT